MRDSSAQLVTSLFVIATATIVGVATVFVFLSMFGTLRPGIVTLSPALATGTPATSPSLTASAAPAPTTVAATATAGPTESPSPTLSPSPEPTAASPQPTPIVHVVAPGEYLSLIAERHGVTLEELIELNEIEDAEVIFVGQRLLIPVPDD